MRLRDLNAHLVRYTDGHQQRVDRAADASAIFHKCPACAQGASGHDLENVHSIRTPFRQSEANSPGEPLWQLVSGESIDDLTLTPSIAVVGGCKAHFFIHNGGIELV